ncbi:MAG: hypothetical protein ACLFPE_11260 [Bacteroidales bacterium]
MEESSMTRNVLLNIGKIILTSIVFAFGLVASRMVLESFGISAPRLPAQADESTAAWYLPVGSLLVSAGFYPLVRTTAAGVWERFAYLFFFIFTGFAVGVTIESSIYSSVAGYPLMIVVLFAPVFLYTITAVLLTHRDRVQRHRPFGIKNYFRNKTRAYWLWRMLLAILAFPVVYFLFGLIVSPIVTPYYQTLVDGFRLPEPGIIIAVQFFRSTIFLLVTLPVLIYWAGSKGQLIAALGFAHFVMVFGYDIVLAIQMPAEIAGIHGMKILLDSFVYAWVFVGLLWNR